VDVKIGVRGQVTIPKEIRKQKVPKKLNLAEWKGRCGDAFAKLGHSSVDKFIDDVRGR
jgi:bifunctional DNA-binding transcriptional regulator/antitoxin component of YhaV-PrlF toxin-antitoxin module